QEPTAIAAPKFRYALKRSDAGLLEAFVNCFRPLLRASKSDAKPTPVQIAFSRYKDAVSLIVSTEARITSAINAIEALFLKGDDQGELVFRLALRTASLLRNLGLPGLEVRDCVKSAYRVRSKFIHGSVAGGERSEELEKCCTKILEYTRLSLLVCFQLFAS